MDDLVTKTARDPATARVRTLFYGSAREGMQDLLADYARTRPGVVVLLPSFIGWSPHEGSGVLDPVRGAGLAPVFYRLHQDLSIDVDHLREVLGSVVQAVVVLIHYYGRTPAGLEEAAALAQEHGALVLEDLAHGFFSARSTGPAGTVGDVLMFSLHKMFPTPDSAGGMLSYRRGDVLREQAETRPELARLVLDYDWRAIAAARRRHFLALLDGLEVLARARDDLTLMWPVLADHDVPQTLPVRVPEGRRDEVYHRMNAEGFGMVSLYHTLVPELRGDEAMSEVSRTVINFPVHQDLDPEQIGPMLRSFESALGEPPDGRSSR